MLYSTDRILTTHAGSLPRPPDLRDMVFDKANGEPHDPTELDERLKSAVAEVVRRQVECGIDCVNDGELSKTNFTDYVRWRIAGYEARPSSGARRLSITARDERKFAGYFAANPRNRPAGWAGARLPWWHGQSLPLQAATRSRRSPPASLAWVDRRSFTPSSRMRRTWSSPCSTMQVTISC
jgi:hypothetical protein